ncbi:hypothetical protein GOBAR_AA03010 [Gossypium barbadense]|uniref:Uncharacterized protein n=1 Tax=Gossypium barbadense TaxID=3634 RepID=A0A2P5YPN5_GOSBA|nr:hypothetical protein GOBAR_AA03010 [Gossypium barbadense]
MVDHRRWITNPYRLFASIAGDMDMWKIFVPLALLGHLLRRTIRFRKWNLNKEITDGDFIAVQSSKGKEIINGFQHGHKFGDNYNDQPKLMGTKTNIGKNLEMEQTSLERVAQPSLVATGNCSLTLVAGAITNASIIKNSPKDAGESSTIFLPAVISKGDEPKAMAVA